jgi:aryl-alcohol dehydrogenase-like predicted oxidoreductase
MSRPPPPDRFASLEKISTVFHVGSHRVRVSKVNEGRWTYAVDDGETSSTFATQAAAWEAGVRAADHLDVAPRG